MTTPTTAHVLLQMAAAQARIEGMKAANQHRVDSGYAQAYSDDAFFSEADLLEQLARDVINQSDAIIERGVYPGAKKLRLCVKKFKLANIALWLLAAGFAVLSSVLYAQTGNLAQSILMGATAIIQGLAAVWVQVNIKC